MNRDRVAAIVFFIFSCCYTFFAFDINVPDQSQNFNARTMPFTLGILGMLISLLMIFLSAPKQEPLVFSTMRWQPVVSLAILMVVYGFIVTRLGFIISTLIFLNGGFWILGERRFRVMFYASVPLVTGLWLVLTQLLNVYLASGSLFI